MPIMDSLVKDKMPLCPYGEGILGELGEHDGNTLGTRGKKNTKNPTQATSFPEKKNKILNP
jgi:hypothetical protein